MDVYYEEERGWGTVEARDIYDTLRQGEDGMCKSGGKECNGRWCGEEEGMDG